MGLVSAIKKYFKFTLTEVRDIAICAIMIGFIFSFTDWGVDKFNISIGIRNLINTIFIVALAFLVHITAQKIYSINKGYEAIFKNFVPGLLLGVILVVLTNGLFKVIIFGGITLSAIALQRVGHEKPIIKHIEMGMATFMGPLANILLALFFKILANYGLNAEIATKAMSINIWMAIFSMIPFAILINPFIALTPRPKLIPSMNGSTILFSSRLIYAFGVVFVITCSAIMFYVNPFSAALAAAILGLATMFAIIRIFEL